MQIKNRLIVMSILQFYVWGAWLITMANYWFGNSIGNGAEFGAVFGTMGIASVFTPTLMGLVADRWINAERVYGILHILYAVSDGLQCSPRIHVSHEYHVRPCAIYDVSNGGRGYVHVPVSRPGGVHGRHFGQSYGTTYTLQQCRLHLHNDESCE